MDAIFNYHVFNEYGHRTLDDVVNYLIKSFNDNYNMINIAEITVGSKLKKKQKRILLEALFERFKGKLSKQEICEEFFLGKSTLNR